MVVPQWPASGRARSKVRRRILLPVIALVVLCIGHRKGSLQLAQVQSGGVISVPAKSAEPADVVPDVDAEESPDLPNAVNPRTMTQRSYRLRAAAGNEIAGELHGVVEGEMGFQAPRWWSLEYHREWLRRFRGFRPTAKVHAGLDSYGAAVRWARDLLPQGNGADGSGLDLVLETSLDSPLPHLPSSASEPDIGKLRPSASMQWKQRAELVFGPRAQKQLLNLTLPVGFLLGAVFRPLDFQVGPVSRGAGARMLGTVPVSFYVRANFPGRRPLRGWLCQAEVQDSWAGLFRGALQQPWRHGDSVMLEPTWSFEHLRTHGPVAVPQCLVDVASGLSSQVVSTAAIDDLAVIPSTRLRASNNGNDAGLGLTSVRSDAGDRHWDSGVQLSREGWDAKLRLDSGTDAGSYEKGRAFYTFGASAPWRGTETSAKPSFSHHLQWLLGDGQGLWAKLQHTSGRKPRLNVGVEVR